MRSSILIATLLMVPGIASATIGIHEVAWMGDSTSANYEWIELYNESSSPVTVDGWLLKDGMNLEIALSGTIAGNEYAVLERTSDASAPGPSFLIYTGALVNTGATLTLYDENGSIVDQVAGGENWVQIGGDNATKETAQYTQSGWVTDTPTPGQSNRAGRVEEEADEANDDAVEPDTTPKSTATSKSKASSGSRGETVRLNQSDSVLNLLPDVQKVVYVHQTFPLSVEASSIGDTIKHSLVYTWNFGDTYTATGKEVYHAYDYPGTYVVTVRGVFGRHDQVVRQEITVLPVTVSITRNEQGDVQLHNDAPYDIDISGYTLRGSRSVVMPEHTIIIAKGTLTVAAKRLHDPTSPEVVTLFDQAKNQLVMHVPGRYAVEVPPTVMPVAMASTQHRSSAEERPVALAAPTSGFTFAGASSGTVSPVRMETPTTTITAGTSSEKLAEAPTVVAGVATSASVVVPSNTRSPSSAYIGWFILLGIALVALLIRPKKLPGPVV